MTVDTTNASNPVGTVSKTSHEMLTDNLYKRSIAKRALAVTSGFIPMLVVPYLYFIGRFYDMVYYDKLGIPIGIVNNDMPDTLLTGFIYGVISPLSTISIYIGSWLSYLIGMFYLSLAFIFLPWAWNKVMAFIEFPFIKIIRRVGKDKSLEYVESVESNIVSATWISWIWLALESIIIFGLLLSVVLPVSKAMDTAKQNAIKFITKSDKTNCQESYGEDCLSFATITLKSITPVKPTSSAKPTKQLSGYIVTSSAKEWAIYQPPYVTKEKVGQMVVIKSQNIIEVRHPIQLTGLIEQTDSK